MSELNLGSLAPEEVPVRINGKTYVLTEPSDAATGEYQDNLARYTKWAYHDGRAYYNGVEGPVSELARRLLGQCLHCDTADGPLVPYEEISRWPRRITRPLIDRVKLMGVLEEEDAESLEARITELQKKLSDLHNADTNLKNS